MLHYCYDTSVVLHYCYIIAVVLNYCYDTSVVLHCCYINVVVLHDRYARTILLLLCDSTLVNVRLYERVNFSVVCCTFEIVGGMSVTLSR